MMNHTAGEARSLVAQGGTSTPMVVVVVVVVHKPKSFIVLS